MKEKPKKKWGQQEHKRKKREKKRGKERIFVSKRLGFVRGKEGNERDIFGER